MGEPGLVEAYDTTLRDGTQREGLSLSCDDKIRIARRLDTLGVSFVEGGWPGSNPKDVEFFQRALDTDWAATTITAFGATRRKGCGPEDDASLRALLDSGASTCTIFGKTWNLHVTEVLRAGLDQNLLMIEESVAYLRGEGRRVIYDAEHFFDGWRADAVYALETLRAAVRGGAETIVLCDTNGGSLPWDVEAVVREVAVRLEGYPLGVHCHDDGGLAVANSLAAVRSGARHVQGTINGYGERCGNANLCAVLPDLELKMGLRCLQDGGLKHLTELAHFVSEVANVPPPDHSAYVGRSAFAHKGGVHVSAIRRVKHSYEHVEPERVGNATRVVVSELSGRANVLSKAEELGLSVSDGVEARVLHRIKECEALGYSYEAAEASVALMLERERDTYTAPFEVIDYKVLVGHQPTGASGAFSEASVKVRVGDETVHTVAEGAGPVEALDRALRKALTPSFPAVERIHLHDYKVRILDGRAATSAITRVLIDSSDGEREWSTVGASPNIIEASCIALVDGIEYGLAGHAAEARSGSDRDDDEREIKENAA